MEGYIKLFRKSMQSAVFHNPNLWQVWTYCLMRANHTETKILFNGKEECLKPGQFITGRFKGANDCNMKPGTFKDQLTKLKKMGNIDIKSDNKRSIITVVKWAEYQCEYDTSDTKSDNSPTTTRHRQECNNERNIICNEIFKYWNSQKIVVHKNLNQKTKTKINSALKNYSSEDIKTAITNYATILQSDEYYFDYKWTLADFLSRGIEKFLDLEIAKNNYLKQNSNKPGAGSLARAFIKPVGTIQSHWSEN